MRLVTQLAAGTAVAYVATFGVAEAGETLDAIKAKGFIQCGVSTGLAGFSNPDDAGNWSGLDVDVCRAVALEDGALVVTDAARASWRLRRSA